MIVINAAIFLIVNLIAHLFMGGNEGFFFRWFGLPPLLSDLFFRPWALITYMFMHGGLWHLVFNMYMLFWFGRIFGDFMGDKRLAGLYFLGGIGGAALFLLVYSMILLAGEKVPVTALVGSSAAVMAITVAAGARFPDYTVNLLFFGAVRLKYVALVIFLLSTVIDFTNNMGGKIAHLGGAAVGYIYVLGLNKGRDYALSFYGWYEKLISLFKRTPKLKVVDTEPKSARRSSEAFKATASGSAKSPDDKEMQAKTDAILDKISKTGYDNLTKEEKEFLFKLSKK